MTPREYYELLKRLRLERQRQEYGPAVVASSLWTIFTKKSIPARKFMPSMAEVKEKKREQSWQEQLAIVNQLHVMFGGKPREGRS